LVSPVETAERGRSRRNARSPVQARQVSEPVLLRSGERALSRLVVGGARNAWSDIRERRRRAGWGSGDPQVQQLLEEQLDRDGFLEALDQEFLVELYEEAKARVQLRVTPQTWQAFVLLAIEGWSGAQVAAELGIKLATVYVAKNRVQKMLQEEVHKLERRP
jgi:DNA-directed RNA polymerase specialized sigma24 family protein